MIGRVKQQAGKTTPTDSRSKRTRASRRGGHLLTPALSRSSNNGLPDHIYFRIPPPGPSHRTHHPGRSARPETVPRHGRHLPPFIPVTNAIEALNRQLRKAIKTKGSFPTEDAARKLVYLALQNAVPQWTRTRNWTTALLAFKIHFGERVPDTAN
jgi:Transposase, Mutator family